MGAIFNQLDALYTDSVGDFNITTLIVHHSNRAEGSNYRGSSAIEADISNMWRCSKTKIQNLAKIETQKFKDAEPVEFFAHFDVDKEEDSLKLTGYSIDVNKERDGQ